MLRHCRAVRLYILLLLILWIGGRCDAQGVQTVEEGGLYGLGIVPEPGGSYQWRIFTDPYLLDEADSTEVVFPSGNTGPAVPVVWLKSGLYYYTVWAENAQGCSNLKVGQIIVGPVTMLPAITIRINRNPVCAGAAVKFWAFPVNPGSYAHFQWLKNGAEVGMNGRIYIDSMITDNDRVSCRLTTYPTQKLNDPYTLTSNEIQVTVYDPKAVFAIKEEGAGSSGHVQLVNHSTGADDYEWELGNGLSSMQEHPEAVYTEDGVYLIRLVASRGGICADTTEKPYRMMFKGLYIPNAFAPVASNGLPGVFQPAGINLKRFRIEVYDNWGHLLWQSTALGEGGVPTESWDGTFQGRMMPQDTYLWKAEAEFTDGTIWTGSEIGKGPARTVGTVTLIK